MTIEQRYDEALKRAKKLYEQGTITESLSYVFPELKESEDEKIKKEIINYINFAESNNLLRIDDYEKKKGWIAWLEKQSTPQVRTGLEWVNTIDDACDKRYAEEYAHGEYCHEQSFKWGFQEGVDWLEEQGESTDINPSEFDLRLNKLLKQFETLSKEELASSLSFYLNVVQNNGTYKADEKQGEQKPAEWSEEDENVLEDIEEAIINYWHGDTQDILLDWLKSLKGRVGCEVNCTTIKEWSEEDEKIINKLIAVVELYYGICDDLDKQRCLSWLESLKPQNHWKPSDEQMDALLFVVRHYTPNISDKLAWDSIKILELMYYEIKE